MASLCRRNPFLCREIHSEVFDIRNLVRVSIQKQQLPLPAVKDPCLRSFVVLGKQRTWKMLFFILKFQRLLKSRCFVIFCSAITLVLMLIWELSEWWGSPKVLADLIILDKLIMEGKLTASIQGQHLLIKQLLFSLKEWWARAAIRTSYAILASDKLLLIDLASWLLIEWLLLPLA